MQQKVTGSASSIRFFLTVFLSTITGYYWRFGIEYGTSDQDEFLPFILSMLDPSLFQQDWFVQSLYNGLNVRSFFLYLIYLPATFLPLPFVVLGIQFISWILLIWGLINLFSKFTQSQSVLFFAVFSTLVITFKWTLGANELVYHLLTPESIAWAFGIWAICFFLEKKWLLSSILLSLSIICHLIVGLSIVFLLVPAYFLRLFKSGEWKKAWSFFLPLLLVGLLFLLPLFIHQLEATTTNAETVFTILAQFRLSVHHFPFSFHTDLSYRFLIVFLIGFVSVFQLYRKGVLRQTRFIFYIFFLAIILCGVSLFFTLVVPNLWITKFQFLKLTVLLKAFSLLFIFQYLCSLLPELTKKLDKIFAKQFSLIASAMFLILTILCIIFQFSKPFQLTQPLQYASSELAEVEEWVAQYTEKDAVFLIPPSNTTFRIHAKRAVYVNWLSFPFEDSNIIEWYRRLETIAPHEIPKNPKPMGEKLDRSYHKNLHQLSRNFLEKNHIQYFLVDKNQLPDEINLEQEFVFSSNNWVVLDQK